MTKKKIDKTLARTAGSLDELQAHLARLLTGPEAGIEAGLVVLGRCEADLLGLTRARDRIAAATAPAHKLSARVEAMRQALTWELGRRQGGEEAAE